ncbi:MAG: ABC transporter ATP-binding protein [Oscillospiraceae bacterium]|nr:ABC transporter ATP-binding protein [Oscillospiraceae bacterium]
MKKKTAARILAYIAPHKKYLALSFISAVAQVVFTLLGPVFIGWAIDCILGPGQVDHAAILKYLAGAGAALLLAGVFQWMMNVNTQKVASYAARDFRFDAFHKLNKAPLSYIDSHHHGDIIARFVTDADLVSDGLQQGLTQFLPGIVTIAGTLIIMFVLNPLIALAVVLITPLSVFFAAFIAKKSRSSFIKQATAQGDMTAYINEMVANQTLVRVFGNEEKCQKEFEAITRRYFQSGLKAQFYSSISNPGTRFVNGIVYAAVCVVGAFSVIGGGLTVGQLSCFLTYANQYTKPFNEISGVVTQLQTGLTSAQRIFEVIDLQPEEPEGPGALAPETAEGAVEARDVSFRYQAERPLIEHFNLRTRPGQKIAIVGPTGCGKTTLINLLMRFYEVDGGEITVDGVPSKAMKRDALRRLYGMVLQETWLQQATVRENIAYARPGASSEEVEAAAKAAYAHSFIKRLPKGYDTLITTGGGNLSAGQKQLLCIARIMLAKPDMLILDEATSNIDTRTELLIQAAFEKLMKGRTSFVVAHRLSTIQSADVILVMRDGCIIEQGSHSELLRRGGFYRDLYESQFAVQ